MKHPYLKQYHSDSLMSCYLVSLFHLQSSLVKKSQQTEVADIPAGRGLESLHAFCFVSLFLGNSSLGVKDISSVTKESPSHGHFFFLWMSKSVIRQTYTPGVSERPQPKKTLYSCGYIFRTVCAGFGWDTVNFLHSNQYGAMKVFSLSPL